MIKQVDDDQDNKINFKEVLNYKYDFKKFNEYFLISFF